MEKRELEAQLETRDQAGQLGTSGYQDPPENRVHQDQRGHLEPRAQQVRQVGPAGLARGVQQVSLETGDLLGRVVPRGPAG